MKTNFSRISMIAFALTLLSITSCKKDNFEPPLPDEKVMIAFSPSLNGEVVPWLKSDKKSTKGFNDFENRFFQHVIRIYKSDNSFIIDIPTLVWKNRTY